MLNVPDEIIPFLFFSFQKTKFKFDDAIKKIEDTTESEVEILPGIFFAYAIDNAVLRNVFHFVFQQISYVIRNENRKDSFDIQSELERQTINASHSKNLISSSIEYLSPQLIEQPGNLGGGKCGGCNVRDYFMRIGLMEKMDYKGYFFFEERDLLIATREEIFFLDELCQENGCFTTYKKIIENGYIMDDQDQIKVEYYRGKYSAEEGKHRICVMKRFGYDQEIPMLVTRLESTELIDNSDREDCFNNYFGDMNYVLENCYTQYEKIGISSGDVRKLLKDPDATVLDYLRASRYSYREIYDRCKPSWI